MKTIYIECNMGAAGDMLMAALLELCDDKQGFPERLNAAGIPGVAVTSEPSVKCGITGTRVVVKVDGREEDCHSHDDHDHHHHHDHHHDHHEHDHDHHDHHEHDHNHREHDHRDHDHHHHHNDYHNIECLINGLNVSNSVKKNSLDIYKLIAEAESHAHGVPVDKIHFHEVGEMDAVADIVGVCMLIEELAPDVIISSPINVGGGYVRCAHGVLPVPAPATAHILRGVPVYGCGDGDGGTFGNFLWGSASQTFDGGMTPATPRSDKSQNHGVGELCTPTGAAILKHFAKKFCAMPVMTVGKIGYGMGKKDFEQANCVRAYFGDVVAEVNNDNDCITESVVELSCNLDDMTPEAVAFACELLREGGALDVWTTPIVMKKGRLGTLLCCLCRDNDKRKMLGLIFKHTTTLGVRESIQNRYILHREQSEVSTPHGTVRVKTAHGFGVEKSKPEYEDMARIAQSKDMSIQNLYMEVGLRPTFVGG